MASASERSSAEAAARIARATRRETDFVTRLLEQIEHDRAETERSGGQFIAPTEEQLVKKLTSTNSPFFTSSGFREPVPRGTTFNYRLGVFNP